MFNMTSVTDDTFHFREQNMLSTSWFCLKSALVLFVAFFPWSLRAEPATTSRATMPKEAELASARERVAVAFENEMRLAKSTSSQVALAEKLRQTAKETTDSLPARFVLLSEAARYAAKAGDPSLAVSIESDLAAQFDVDSLSRRFEILTLAANSSKTPQAFVAIYNSASDLVMTAIAEDKYDLASQVAELALTASRKANDSRLVANATRTQLRVKETTAAYRLTDKARVTLEKIPADPEANLELGRFECFFKQNWTPGLKLLVLGRDQAMAELAERDLKASTPQELAAAGDGWWDAAEAMNGVTRENVQGRALDLYKRALPNLAGLTKAVALSRLGEADAIPKPMPLVSLHYFSPDLISKIRFLDWINDTWENDIRQKIQVTKLGNSYQYESNLDGYQHKILLFPNEDVTKRVLVATFRITQGACAIGFKPKDLHADGSEFMFEGNKRFTVRLWLENGIEKILVNNRPGPMPQKPSCHGYFQICPTSKSSIAFDDLHFEDIRPSSN